MENYTKSPNMCPVQKLIRSNRQIKVLRIMSDRYRNRRRRHGLRMNIICAIRNCEIRYVKG